MTKEIMIVLSKWKDKKYEDSAAKQLSGYSGVNILLIPHLYYLKNNYDLYKKIMEFKGNIFICSWLPERAAEWIIKKETNLNEKKAVKYLSFAKYKKPGELVTSLVKNLKLKKGGKAILEDRSKILLAERWYPVIDYSKCKNCKKCLEFCVFGVYTLLGQKKKVKVENPEKCKPGCPACSRICQKGAIMFPHYFDDKKICGWEV